MQKYMKKPVEVEAVQITEENCHEVAAWCGGNVNREVGHARFGIDINTLEGVMLGKLGDWIIKGVNGEFYPCKPDIFDKTYDEVSTSIMPTGGHITILSITDLNNGYFKMDVDMDNETIKTFASIGIVQALKEAVAAEQAKDIETFNEDESGC